MISLLLAIKSFFKALKDPKGAEIFLKGSLVPQTLKDKKEDPSHLHLLTILQQSSRLIDFFKEDITGYTDAQIGAATRQIHSDCAKSLEDVVTIRPLLSDHEEGSTITIPKGYNPTEIKIIGKVVGDGPYHGVIIHRGWKAHKRSLPVRMESQQVISAAEIEVK